MTQRNSKNSRILGIAPGSRGFGFAILENGGLVDWGIKCVGANKNVQSLSKFIETLEFYKPGVVVLEDYSGKDSRRSLRIRILGKDMAKTAKKHSIELKIVSRHLVRKFFLSVEKGTKHALAEMLVKYFPAELGPRLPHKRRPWESESYQMGIFDSAALALFHTLALKT